MGNGKKTGRQRLSTGTVFMLVLLTAVTGASMLVLGRLSSGTSVDLSKLQMSLLNLQADHERETENNEELQAQRVQKTETITLPTATPAPAETVPPTGDRSFTLTAGGSVSLSGEVRKNSRNADMKVADYADTMMLLAPEIRSDVSIVFLENNLSDSHKTNDYTAPVSAAGLLKEAGFDMAACGFSQAYVNGKGGIEAPIDTLESQGTGILGIRRTADSGEQAVSEINGIQAVFLQYTATIPAKTRGSMAKEGTSAMVPEADISLITQDIETARKEGAEAVVVFVSWGKTGKDPDKAQRKLAEEIAQAGADLIIGNGSHVPQTAEYFRGTNGRDVLCAWSLGSLLSGDRSNIKRISGYMLHVTIRCDAQGNVTVIDPEYTPVYTWKYKQDGRFYYRCIAAGGNVPDGMDKEQRGYMEKAAETVGKVLAGSPVAERKGKDAD